jgi:anti-sigma factor RsiW
MTCREVLDRIEAVAAGDEPATPELRSHLEECLACAAALAQARRIESVLAERPAPSAPARFSAALTSRIRQERWRSEQQVDRMFNVVLLAGVLAIAVGVLALFNVNAMAAAFTGSLALLNRLSGALVVQAAPAFAAYLGAAGFLATALFVWWWAERRLSL